MPFYKGQDDDDTIFIPTGSKKVVTFIPHGHEDEYKKVPGGWIHKDDYKKMKLAKRVKEEIMTFKDLVRMYLGEGRKEGAYKSLAHSAGGSVAGTKAEMKKLERTGVARDIHKRAHGKGITNPEAYEYGTKRKILKQHFAKGG
jgi:hypothetical protein